ncbi:MAG: type VI secretion system baseplate subunit TssK [Sedimentisphaerales bacterium]|nr:type VI secretion system baseplate subunit TssK [Sedimentisphaerales bacterium]
MEIDTQIHWCEGLFLQPHHLQAMQRSVLDKFARERRFLRNYAYGVVEAKVSDDELENMRVRFDRLRVLMPSGLEVNVPDNADLPARDIKEAFVSSGGALTIMLGVPLWYASRRNVVADSTSEDHRANYAYRVAEIERVDENTGENPQPIQIRRVNARLLIEGRDDVSDLEVMPLLRIVGTAVEDVAIPRRDPDYIPPCLTISGSPVLRELVRDIASQIMASRNELVLKLGQRDFAIENLRGRQFEQVLRLRTLNKFGGVLDSLVRTPRSLPTFEMYLLLRECLGELAALRPQSDQFQVAEYDHDNPALAFNELYVKIRSLIKGSIGPTYLEIPFTRNTEGKLCFFEAVLTDQAISSALEYFLSIKTETSPQQLLSLVEDPDKFKLMPASFKDRMVFGVKLKHESYQPVELPAQKGMHYFRLLRADSVRMWDRILREKAIAATWPGAENSDFDMKLYMTIPEMEEK